MKQKKLTLADRLLLFAGLFVTMIPQIFRAYLHLPDFLLGAIIGVGIGLQFTVLLRMRLRRNKCVDPIN